MARLLPFPPRTGNMDGYLARNEPTYDMALGLAVMSFAVDLAVGADGILEV